MPQELVIPEGAVTQDCLEIIRVWIGQEGTQFFLLGNVWDDPAAFGILLVDLIRHYTRASEVPEAKRAPFIERVVAGFKAEVESPTE